MLCVPAIDCSQAESCDLCVGVSMLNLTGCVWRLCPTVKAHEKMPLLPPHLPVSCHFHLNPSKSPSSLLPGDGSNPNPSSEFSQAKFDMSSFIGGIILVLCLQAGGFFAMRFLKSKEQSSYDPM
uniref:CD164 sialomucin-like 2 protein n=1 Tax=Labrus bergylta TaxID=56723 RepID=A0A3Q3EA80_9LABR